MAQCRYCGEVIEMNEDTEATRAAGTDPHQQFRRHIAEKHAAPEVAGHARALGWLLDMLWFHSPSDPANYRKAINDVVSFYVDECLPRCKQKRPQREVEHNPPSTVEPKP